MTDREGNRYQVLMRKAKPRDVPMCVLSPARQAKKASGRTGRQWRKFYKAQRHIASYERDIAHGRIW